MNHSDGGNLFKNQSTKSLMKYRSEDIEKRAMRIGKELLVPGLNRKREQKNVFTITANTSNFSHKSQEPRGQEALQRRVRMLEYELKKKLQEDSLLKNIFRTKQTHEMNHIDLILELRALEEKYKQLVSEEQKSRATAQQCQQELEEVEQNHMRNIEKIGEQLNIKEEEWFSQKVALKEQIQKLKMLNQNNKFLVEQLQKKNNQLSTKNRQIIEETEMERNSQNLQFIKYKSEKTNQIEQMTDRLKAREEEFSLLHQQKQALAEQLEHLRQTMEKLNDQNQKLQMKVKELEQHTQDLSRHESVSKKEQKQKVQKITKEHSQQISNLMKEHQAIMLKEKQSYQYQLRDLYIRYETKIKEDQQSWKLETQYLIKEHEITVKKEKNQIMELKKQLSELYSVKETKIQENIAIQSQLAEVKQKMSQKQSQLATLLNDLQQEKQNSVKLAKEVKELDFEKEQLNLRLDRLKFQLSDQLNFTERLQSELKYNKEQYQQLSLHNQLKRVKQENQQLLKRELNSVKEQNNQLLDRCQELKKAVEMSQNHLLMNDRAHNENYNNQNIATKVYTENNIITMTGKVKEFSREPRERAMTRYSSKRKEKEVKHDRREELRSEVEKKYFR